MSPGTQRMSSPDLAHREAGNRADDPLLSPCCLRRYSDTGELAGLQSPRREFGRRSRPAVICMAERSVTALPEVVPPKKKR